MHKKFYRTFFVLLFFVQIIKSMERSEIPPHQSSAIGMKAKMIDRKVLLTMIDPADLVVMNSGKQAVPTLQYLALCAVLSSPTSQQTLDAQSDRCFPPNTTAITALWHKTPIFHDPHIQFFLIADQPNSDTFIELKGKLTPEQLRLVFNKDYYTYYGTDCKCWFVLLGKECKKFGEQFRNRYRDIRTHSCYSLAQGWGS